MKGYLVLPGLAKSRGHHSPTPSSLLYHSPPQLVALPPSGLITSSLELLSSTWHVVERETKAGSAQGQKRNSIEKSTISGPGQSIRFSPVIGGFDSLSPCPLFHALTLSPCHLSQCGKQNDMCSGLWERQILLSPLSAPMPPPTTYRPQSSLCMVLPGPTLYALCLSDSIPSLQRKQLTDLYTVAIRGQKKELGPSIITLTMFGESTASQEVGCLGFRTQETPMISPLAYSSTLSLLGFSCSQM